MKRFLTVLLLAAVVVLAGSTTAFSQTAPRALVSWNAITTNGATPPAPITGVTYNVLRGLKSDGSDLAKINGAAIALLSYQDNSIDGVTVYYYSVTGINPADGVEGKVALPPVRFTFADVQPATATGVKVQ